jgi:hypothetical protein
MRIWLTRLAWIGGIFLLVWLAVVIYWQSTSRMPSEADVALYLVALPLVVAAACWGVYKLATRPQSPAADSTAATQSNAEKISAAAAEKTAAQESGWTLNIVATSLQTSAGQSASEVLGKLKNGAIESELDPELKTPEGFAVFSARIADLDGTDTQQAIAEWQKNSTQPDLLWSENQYRALHLATQSVSELVPMAAVHPAVQRYVNKKDDTLLPLRLVPLWPKYWSPGHQSLASEWLKFQTIRHGWPEHRIVMQEIKSEHTNPISVLDYVCVSSRRAQLPTLGILLACDSGIDQEYVDTLASENRLFGGKNNQGNKPGEVAAGLLFADAQQSLLLGEGPFSSLHRASWASRDKSANERGRVSAELLGNLTGLALQTSKVDTAKVQFVSSDNDHKSSREAELAQMLTAIFPELDPAKDAVKVAQACGSMDHVATVAALCVAHQYVIDEQAPAVCTSLHDPLLRAVVVLTVATPENSEDKPGDAKIA